MGEPKYTIYVRVPIPRGDFVDPPQVSWFLDSCLGCVPNHILGRLGHRKG